ncbi:hypothetical protein Lalb_Chr19g0125281 [Lupinus albus]|uniref:Uncharacterized protein n=1 Tax=Lupinus albus TaxID=3870 RepID=A0A6A4NIV3_LUPAL|nr:hypothetical protein Lalb_Chr19g0125281 [Lupinus albus]
MCDSSLLGNHLEGQGQNVLEREDERFIHVKGNFDRSIEPDRRNHGYLPNDSTARKLVHRDDDGNFVRCTQPISRNKISG